MGGRRRGPVGPPPVSALVAVLTAALVAASVSGCGGPEGDTLTARVVAVGIPGAGPVSTIGRFLPGGPINDKPEFRAFTESGRVLEAARVLVGSSGNFGAAPAVESDLPGALLSIDVSGPDVLGVPAQFARKGGQATAANGRVQLYSAQNPAFLNSVTAPGAVTATAAGISNPLDLSINNAFGRLWPANAPRGLAAEGSETILDPGGMPLAGAPNPKVGGVFAGSATNRAAQVVPGGLAAGAVGTAFLGRALDDPRRAVFAVVTADGAILQAHTEQGVDGLAPPGTLSDLRGRPDSDQLHAGAVLHYYAPEPVLFVADPVANEVVWVGLARDDVGKVRRVSTVGRFRNPAFAMPVDLAPTLPEGRHRDWSSNTTLAELADIYVLNRGNNTICRMKIDGTVVATRAIAMPDGAPLGSAEVNGIATSMDGEYIYVTVTGTLPGRSEEGGLLELPGFGGTR